MKKEISATIMRSVKEKVSNAASAAQEHVDIYKAHVEEKVT